MKPRTIRQTALYLSGVFTLVAALILAIILNLRNVPFWLIMTPSLLLICLVSYFILLRWMQSFLYKKIDPIYKIIHKASLSKKEFDDTYKNAYVGEELKNDADRWAQGRSLEIDQLKQMEKYRKEFLGNVSHELKTPIFNIQGYILTLLEGGMDDPDINRLYLERTEKSINRIITIVEDLETIARLESGEMKLSFEPFNLTSLVEEVFESQEMQARSNGIRLVMKHPSAEPVMVTADKSRIFQALTNLVVNSITYGKKDGKTTVSFSEMGENILVEVEDNGIGIAEKDIPRIFERFYRVDKSRSRNMGGTGLGLSIVKHIIEAHHQTLSVRSKQGEGTVFGFTLAKM